MITVWIDADSCPAPVRNYAERRTEQIDIRLKFVANRGLTVKKSDKIEFIVSRPGKDSADNIIYENVQDNDLVITRDLLFADRLVRRHIAVMNDSGTVFSAEDMEILLAERELSLQLAEAGIVKKTRRKHNPGNMERFRANFDRMTGKLLDAAQSGYST